MDDERFNTLIENNRTFAHQIQLVQNEEIMKTLTKTQYDIVVDNFKKQWAGAHQGKLKLPDYIIPFAGIAEAPNSNRYDQITNQDVAAELRLLERQLYVAEVEAKNMSAHFKDMQKQLDAKDKTIERLQNRNDYLVRKTKNVDMVTFNEIEFDV